MPEIQTQNILSNELVRYSRAGDAFHYRFAANFCLDMINPKSDISKITVEGSNRPRNPSKSGEYVIDLGIYKDNLNKIEFYQLKHTTVRKNKVMNMSEIKDTIIGFSKRFTTLKKEKSNKIVTFIVATNRTVNPAFVKSIKEIAKGNFSSRKNVNTLLNYTKFSKKRLKEFCKHFLMYDSLGDYKEQYTELTKNTQNLITGSNGTDVVNGLIALIESRVLPDCDKPITKEDVLKHFGCNSIDELFPATPEFEKNDKIIWRSEFIKLTKLIESNDKPLVITASGGVGKSIFTNNLDTHLPDNFLIIKYDCFGNGIYRNRRNFRHRYCDFVIQIINELSEKGLCDPIIHTGADDTKLLKLFHSRLQESLKRYTMLHKNAKFLIIIDAADNACMAAKNNNDNTFAKEILHDSFSENINFVLLCRPERKEMLDIPSSVDVVELAPFSIEDTGNFIKIFFENVSKENIDEFHKLTSGNPRIQSIVIKKAEDFQDILTKLRPFKTTVEDQIKIQVDLAVKRLLDELDGDEKENVEMICFGLALLPPDIPVRDLANVIEINETNISSFVSELSGQIWIANGLMHFKDEPTEAYFLNNFEPSNKIVEKMIVNIENNSETSYYLAYALPELYLLVGRYEDLISMVNNKLYLPRNTELDILNLELNRLKFAIKAAINRKKYFDITKLSLTIGQKISEQNRLSEFYKNNIDILNILYSDDFLSDLAFKKTISSEWNDSNILYSALILSFTKQYKTEACSYLRSSEKLLQLYFEEREKDDLISRESLSDRDIFLFALTYYNLYGVEACVNYIKLWQPNLILVTISGMLTKYLIDINNNNSIKQLISHSSNNIHCMIGINGELIKKGKNINLKKHQNLIQNLHIDDFDYPKFNYLNTEELSYIISFCELLAIDGEKDLCLKLLDKYIPIKLNNNIFGNYIGKSRECYIKAFTIRKFYNPQINIDNLPYFTSNEISYSKRQEREKHKGILKSLIPWYVLCFFIKRDSVKEVFIKTKECQESTKLAYHDQFGKFSFIEFEQFKVACQIFESYQWGNAKDSTKFYMEFIAGHKSSRAEDKIEMLRAISRKNNCEELVTVIVDDIIVSIKNQCEEPDEKIEMYTLLARALLAIGKSAAISYFKRVIDEITKYGEELPTKWRVIENLGRMVSEEINDDSELAFRLIRVAEFVGEHIGREKYWNRNEAIKIVTYLSKKQGLASISRWRERDIGQRNILFKSFIEAAIEKKVFSSEQIWGLTGFLNTDEQTLIQISKYCVTNVEKLEDKAHFLEEINKLISINGFSRNYVQEFRVFLETEGLDFPNLYLGRDDNKYIDSDILEDKDKANNKINSFFKEWEFCNIDSLIAVQSFHNKSSNIYYSNDLIWEKIFNFVGLNKYELFLDTIANTDSLELYFVKELINRIPSSWKQCPGFDGVWKNTLEKIGENYCFELLYYYNFTDIDKNRKFSISEYKAFYNGIITGLNKKNLYFNCNNYYNLAIISARMIPYKEIKNFLLLMLNHFECEIDNEFGDGPYNNELCITKNINEVYACYLKIALGSPENEVRWQATHAIIRYCKMANLKEFCTFIEIIYDIDTSGYINSKFEFYQMDFEIQLLIALHRIMIDESIKVYSIINTLNKILENRNKHDLIVYQIYRIFEKLSEIYPDKIKTKKINILEKRFLPKNVIIVKNSYECDKNDKYKNYLDLNYDLYLPFDYNYWLQRFERIFNIPEKHMKNMLKEIIFETFDVKVESDNKKVLFDNRIDLFKEHRFQTKIFASHGEHPSIETLNFYYFYHAFFILAHKLYSNNEIYKDDYDYDNKNPYINLLESELITRNDGYLLYDSKTPVPLRHVDYEYLPIDDKWYKDVKTDYLESLLFDGKLICVNGSWHTRYKEFNEKINISSVLVENEYIDSLITTLRNMKPDDYYIGKLEYQYTNQPFVMTDWIKWESNSSAIENNDPWSLEMTYPGHYIKPCYLNSLDLNVNQEGNRWTNKFDGQTVIRKDVWTEKYGNFNDIETHFCEKILATKEIIKKLCNTSDKVLLINVKVTRNKTNNRYSDYTEVKYYRYHHFKVIREAYDE